MSDAPLLSSPGPWPPLLQVVLERVEKPRTINYKGAIDLVTDTDLASEEAILKVLSHSTRPGCCWDGAHGCTLGDARPNGQTRTLLLLG